MIFGQPFVKRFTLCYQTVVCPVCLSVRSVTLVRYGQTVGWIMMPLDMEVDLSRLSPGDIVLDGDPASPPKKGQSSPPHISAHVYCGQSIAYLSNCWSLVWLVLPTDTEKQRTLKHTIVVVII